MTDRASNPGAVFFTAQYEDARYVGSSQRWSESTMDALLGVVGLIFALALAVSQLVLGSMGLDYLLGWWAVAIAIALLAFLRISLPFTIGTYFGATAVMGWPWWAGVLCALPGLIFMVPAVVAMLAAKLFGREGV